MNWLLLLVGLPVMVFVGMLITVGIFSLIEKIWPGLLLDGNVDEHGHYPEWYGPSG